ncbi:MAG TPA: OB-fold nucleic acid binding domain-containing protein, partial [Pirellulales bacterium]|nr:OB-fold nucleic acid binding domain-containing protein [Pirellulales bacterium]
PVMRELLEETHGVMVYQEQVMRILNRLGGIELSSAYSCIKAISKKKEKDIAKFEGQFVDGTVANGLSKGEAVELFEMIKKFAGYGFNKSHSTAYALIAYQTAYLKAHWPVEFMAALLSGDILGRNFKKKDSLVEHLEDCTRMNVTVERPNVNECDADFVVREGKIYFGLAAIKGCGGAAAEAIRAARRKGGKFRDMFDFCERVDASACNRAAIESLVKAGAFDSCGGNRAQWTASIERALQAGASAASDRRSGQKGLFDNDDPDDAKTSVKQNLPNLPEWGDKEKLLAEREVLGFYLSSHPLAEHESTLKTYCMPIVEATALSHRTECTLGGMIAAIKFSHTKNPQPGKPSKYAMFDLEDSSGIMRTIVWPEQFATYGHMVEPESILALKGVIDKRPGSEEANFIVNELIPLEQLPERFTRAMRLRIDERVHTVETLDRLHEILRGYPGKCAVSLHIHFEDGSRLECAIDETRVEINAEMRERLTELLGVANVHMVAAPRQGASNGASRPYPNGARNGPRAMARA